MNIEKLTSLIKDHSYHMSYKNQAFHNTGECIKNKQQDSKEYDIAIYEYLYHMTCLDRIEYELAEMGIFLHNEISKKRHANWDYKKYSEDLNKYLDLLKEAQDK